ncbi:MAG: glycoside hydrolase family 15 protein, partial [Chloroflexi bacterium]|nr:glycoside hydrolase family 15 protein [Chloroflexota bacterium]
MPYRKISDYGVIGDMHSAALVSSDGSIDWLCFPRFDSPSVFAALVGDANGGYFRIRPAGDFNHGHSYLPDSNVLAANFETDSGSVSLTDFMPVAEEVTHCDHEVVRIVRCERGSVEMELEFQPRLDYARSPTEVRVNGRSVVARLNGDCLSMTSGVPLEATDGGARARFTLKEGEWTAFLLRWDDDSLPLPEDCDVYGKLGRTQAFWRFVAHDWRYMGRWEEVVKRSMLALHLLLYMPTGAICAAVTTSLPEQVGGSRNWDYRFCWLRDAAFTLDVFHRLGHTAYTRPFIEWLAGLVLGLGHGEDIHSLYGIGREVDHHAMTEDVLGHLEGYRGSSPVRIGNDAFHQFQLDIYGEVLLSFDSYHRAGGIIDDSLWILT